MNGGKTAFAMEKISSAFGLAVDGLRLSPNPAEGVGTDEREEVGDDIETQTLRLGKIMLEMILRCLQDFTHRWRAR